MRFRRVWDSSKAVVQLRTRRGWMNMREVLTRLSAQPAKADIELWSTDVVALLGAPQGLLAKVAGAVTNSAVDAGEKAGAVVLAPFEPRSFRDFMLYERHAINAARGLVRTFMPRV